MGVNMELPKDKIDELQQDCTYYLERVNDINLILTEKWKNHVVKEGGHYYKVQFAEMATDVVYFTVTSLYDMDPTPIKLNSQFVEYVREDD